MPIPKLSAKSLEGAIERGLTYLHQVQQPGGDFLTYTGPHLDLAGAHPYPKTVYHTTYLIHALCYVPSHPLVDAIQQRAIEFLQQEQDASGAWSYEGRGQTRIAPDLDDTACATAALIKMDRRPDLSFYQLLWQNESAPGGPYYTLVGRYNDIPDYPHAKQVNAHINANILFCAGLLNLSLPGTLSYLREMAQQDDYLACNFYYVAPHFFIYALSRAYADGGVVELAEVMPLVQTYILQKLAPPSAEPVALYLACAALGLLNSGATPDQVEPYLTALLSQQQANGSWPGWAAHSGYRPHYDGSPALTTALALEACGKYLCQQDPF
jgi:hypothetical protein